MAVFLRGRKFKVGATVTPPEDNGLPFPVTTLTAKAVQVLPKPAFGQSVIENMFGYNVRITRVSTSAAESPTYFPSNTGAAYEVDNGYQTRQPWSRNGTYMKIGFRQLCMGVYPYTPIDYMDTSYKLWSNVEDNKIYCSYKAGYMRVFRPNTQTFDSGNIVDLRGISGISTSPEMTIGQFEGNFSMDDSRVILCATINGIRQNVLVNPLTGQIIWVKPDSAFGVGAEGINTITVSKSGLYILVNRNVSSGGTSFGKRSYTIDGTLVNPDLDVYSHRECHTLEDGTEVLLGANPPIMHNIITGAMTTLMPASQMVIAFQAPGGSIQVSGGYSSGRAHDLGGDWALNSSGSDYARYMEQFFVKTDGSKQVMRICDARMTGARSNGPQACASWDGKRLLFGSDWNNHTGPIDAYVAEPESLAL